jgi:hypothetical protein
MNCTWCDEIVLEEERHPFFQEPTHLECGFRAVGGSVAHVEQRCGCFVPGSAEGDPPGLTKRQAARAALDAYRARWEFDSILRNRRAAASSN